MAEFPRTMVGGVSVSRMIVGTNWFLGYSHTTRAKDDYLKQQIRDPKKIAAILEVFFRAGVNAVMGLLTDEVMPEAIRLAEDRTGVKAVMISTPGFTITPQSPVAGLDPDEVARTLDRLQKLGVTFVLPHQPVTDSLLDRCTRTIRKMDEFCRQVRQRGMVPGLSTHAPESILFADESGLDVETYIAIYNAMGFLMPLEVDWTCQIIQKAKKPVMTIKPMAAGHIRPFQGLTFVWNTLRPCDMVTVGTMTPDEAKELIALSLNILQGQHQDVPLQETRSKAPLKTQR